MPSINKCNVKKKHKQLDAATVAKKIKRGTAEDIKEIKAISTDDKIIKT